MIAIFPELASCAAARDMERLAILVRMYFGDAQRFAPILQTHDVAAKVGIEVACCQDSAAPALLATDERGQFSITAILPNQPAPLEEAQRFLIAHQLGHFFLHIQPQIARGDWKKSGFAETTCPLRRYQLESYGASRDTLETQEQEADDFAASLMMPAAMLRRACQRLGDVDRVASFFGVSVTTLRRRMAQIGLEEDNPKNFILAEKRLGRNSRDDDHPEPKPDVAVGHEATQLLNKTRAMTSYGQKKGAGRSTKSLDMSSQADGQSSEVGDDNQKSGRGMERLREIARRLERGVEK